MTDPGRLERGYRRLLACYPKAFRREHEEEILGVLLAGARDGQQRVRLAESADLIKNALRMRLRPPSRPPRAMLNAIRLMYAGAVTQLAALITIVVTADSVRSAVAGRDPAQWHFLLAHIVAVEVFAPVAIGVWLWSAWANGQGHGRSRGVFAVFWSLMTLGLLGWLTGGAMVYAPADLIACATIWLIQLAAVMLILTTKPTPSYRHNTTPQ